MHLSATTSITVHDNPLRNKHLQRIARVIKATWAKGKKERLEETFSSKRQATRIFVHRKNKSCSLFSTHKQRSSRLSCNLVCRPSTFLVYIYIYTHNMHTHPSIAEIMALSVREKTVIASLLRTQRVSRVIGARHPHESRTGRCRQDRLASETAIVKLTIYSSRK